MRGKINHENCDPFVKIQHGWLTFQGMIALRREATELDHEDYMDAIIEVQAKKKANLMYYA